MNSEDAAWSFLRELVDCAPKPCDEEVALMEADDEKVGFAIFEELHDGIDGGAFDGVRLELEAMMTREGAGSVLEIVVELGAVGSQDLG